ncbi:acyl carrier protein [Streptomyces cellostaticus]|uniref:acyl carrier protein n=1 Tax=Streptomyces cellostaticus TaxID=67285 RepID=UPI00202757B6|nr:phosphopantetheine-binding protein [Streptomyces cellostaticus]
MLNKPERSEWDEKFSTILRQVLPDFSPDVLIDPDQELRNLGLDSMKTVELLLGLESAYGAILFDDELDPRVFSTPRSLWTFVTERLDHDGTG